jgi:hypothetical protein
VLPPGCGVPQPLLCLLRRQPGVSIQPLVAQYGAVKNANPTCQRGGAHPQRGVAAAGPPAGARGGSCIAGVGLPGAAGMAAAGAGCLVLRAEWGHAGGVHINKGGGTSSTKQALQCTARCLLASLTPLRMASAAIFTSLNRAAACGLPSTSGWHRNASCRNARFTSSLLALLGRPSTSKGSVYARLLLMRCSCRSRPLLGRRRQCLVRGAGPPNNQAAALSAGLPVSECCVACRGRPGGWARSCKSDHVSGCLLAAPQPLKMASGTCPELN